MFVSHDFDGWSPNRTGYRHFILPTEERLNALAARYGLAIIKPFSNNYSFLGCCVGGSLTVIALYHEGYSFENSNVLRKAYRNRLQTIILIQKVQRRLLGIGGRTDQHNVDAFAALFKQSDTFILPEEPWQSLFLYTVEFLKKRDQQCLRKALLDYVREQHIPLTLSIYATIVDISSAYDAIVRTSFSNMYYFENDVFAALGELADLQVSETVACVGSLKQLMQKISELVVGAYLIGLPKHACVYVKQSESLAYFWDIGHGVVKEKDFKKILSPWLVGKSNWMTLRCYEKA